MKRSTGLAVVATLVAVVTVGVMGVHIQSGKPFLGICLGQQLLFDVSYEDGEWSGLGVLPGKVVRFQNQPGLPIRTTTGC